ncbi:hypothetical protein [Halocatena pleomorpha]|uniref:DUF8056 domain-containing protein n=1 Tax=Halocatena pleomorpha TaxID=1785090 RepID=A0A3P3RGI0_9EURY|nr:hypothetical protein [Halocatena pleomorpha]RRJ32009.1 hypothetical protein EIK79_05625 [Halocatena pleomorpha]
MDTSTSETSYSGAITAVPYAFRASDSRLCKLYVLVGGLLTLGGTILFGLGTVALLSSIAGVPAGTFTFQPALYLLVWLFVIAPIIAPILLVARQHRVHDGTVDYDRWIALSGFLFLLALYGGALIAAPASQRGAVPSGIVGSIVQFLYGLPREAGLLPPLVAVLVMAAVHRLNAN